MEAKGLCPERRPHFEENHSSPDRGGTKLPTLGGKRGRLPAQSFFTAPEKLGKESNVFLRGWGRFLNGGDFPGKPEQKGQPSPAGPACHGGVSLAGSQWVKPTIAQGWGFPVFTRENTTPKSWDEGEILQWEPAWVFSKKKH